MDIVQTQILRDLDDLLDYVTHISVEEELILFEDLSDQVDRDREVEEMPEEGLVHVGEEHVLIVSVLSTEPDQEDIALNDKSPVGA